MARSFSNAPKGEPLRPIGQPVLETEVLKGIGQAYEFTRETQVSEGFLEIYDMRKDKSPNLIEIDNVQQKLSACTVKVNAELRPMFGSSEEARDVSFPTS